MKNDQFHILLGCQYWLFFKFKLNVPKKLDPRKSLLYYLKFNQCWQRIKRAWDHLIVFDDHLWLGKSIMCSKIKLFYKWCGFNLLTKRFISIEKCQSEHLFCFSYVKISLVMSVLTLLYAGKCKQPSEKGQILTFLSI